jgi:histone-arginine methyltransferase CARM1
VVVDAFDPSVLVSDCATHVLDFASIKEEELYDINIPLNLTVGECNGWHTVVCMPTQKHQHNSIQFLGGILNK